MMGGKRMEFKTPFFFFCCKVINLCWLSRNIRWMVLAVDKLSIFIKVTILGCNFIFIC